VKKKINNNNFGGIATIEQKKINNKRSKSLSGE
jgi:hypothetical protein